MNGGNRFVSETGLRPFRVEGHEGPLGEWFGLPLWSTL